MLCCHFWLTFCAFVCVVFVFANSQWTSADSCRTPDDQSEGTCINIRNCQPMMDFLQSSQSLTSEIKQLLARYRCGFEGKNPKVCCPARSELFQKQPNVKNHANLKLLPKNCGYLDTGIRIIGGNKTSLFEFPWMALLSYNTARGPDFRCGGTIINNRYILTAAHCISNLRYPLLGVRIGEHDISTKKDCEIQDDGTELCAPPYKDLAVEQTIPHPQYDPKSFTNDIGLLRVTKIKFNNENIRPICLPLDQAASYNFTKRNVIVTGWGVADLDTGRSSPDLLKVEIPYIPLAECQSAYQQIRNVKIDERQLCAGGKDRKDSCGGDSGGPLQIVTYLHDDNRYVQQGIVSFGPRDCGKEGNPGVYSKVAYFLEWILDTIKP